MLILPERVTTVRGRGGVARSLRARPDGPGSGAVIRRTGGKTLTSAPGRAEVAAGGAIVGRPVGSERSGPSAGTAVPLGRSVGAARGPVATSRKAGFTRSMETQSGRPWRRMVMVLSDRHWTSNGPSYGHASEPRASRRTNT